MADLLVRVVGDNLEIALKPANGTYQNFDDLTDRVTIADWQDAKRKIEILEFHDGTKLSLSAVMAEFAATAATAPVDIGVVFAGLHAAADPRNVIIGTGEDEILGSAEGNTFIGGGVGDDTLTYSSSDHAVTVDLSAGTGVRTTTGDDPATADTDETVIETDTLSNIENVDGSEFDDTISGDANANTLKGLDGDDTLRGLGGDDILEGGGGDDVLEGGAGADVLDGGEGSDTAVYDGSAEAVTVDLGAETVSGGDSVGDTFISIENLRGSAHDDVLRGDGGANQLDGGAGNDTLEAGDGDDTYVFARGSALDVVSDSGGVDTVRLSAGIALSDIALQIDATSIEVGLKEADDPSKPVDDLVDRMVLTGRDGAKTMIETLSFAEGGVIDITKIAAVADGTDAALSAAAGTASWLNGLDGDDTITGSSEADILIGGAGDDTLSGGDGDDQYVYWAGDGHDIISDTGGLDTLVFGGGITRDQLKLRRGTLTLATATDPASFADSDTGADLRIEVLDATDNTIVTGSVSIQDYRASTTLIERFRIGDDVNVSLADLIGETLATGFDDTFQGSNADEIFAGLGGADTIDGGAGTDVSDYSTSDVAVTVDLGAGTATGGHAEGDVLANIEGLVGSAYDDTLTGDDGANILEGGAGTDTLFGKTGDDVYRFGRGSGLDRIVDQETVSAQRERQEAYTAYRVTRHTNGGEGAPVTYTQTPYTAYRTVTYTVDVPTDAGNDTLSFGAGITAADLLVRIVGQDLVVAIKDPANPAAAFADLADKVTLVNWLDSLDRIETFRFADGTVLGVPQIAGLLGTEEADTITWTETALIAASGAGNDTITAGDFDDEIIGGAGDDTINGAGGADKIAGGDGNDTLNGDAGADELYGNDGVDILNGGSEDDVLMGGAGNDTLDGGTGADDLGGGYGDDLVIGGGGDDTYRFGVGSGKDTVRHTAGTGRVVLAGTITPADMVFTRQGDDLVAIVTADDHLTIEGWFADTSKRVSFELSDGTAIPITVSVIGTDAAETLTGSDDNDIISGLGGDDTLSGLAGSDFLSGGAGADLLQGGAGDDLYRFDRGDGLDRIVDEYHYDETRTRQEAYTATRQRQVCGGEDIGCYTVTETYTAYRTVEYTVDVHEDGGLDVLAFGAGITADDLMVQIDGQDLVVGVRDPANPNAAFADLTDKITLANWLEAKDRIEAIRFADDSVIDVAALEVFTSGTSAADSLTATAVRSWIAGLGGNDVLNGATANDVLLGGSGDDTLNGADGADQLIGGGDNDTLDGGAGADDLDGGAGNDILIGGGGDDVYRFGVGSGLDTVRHTAGAGVVAFATSVELTNIVFTASGDDLIVAVSANDRLTIEGWYADATKQVAFELSDGTAVPVNLAPIAAADSGISTDEDVAVTIAVSTLLANDADPDGGTLTIQSVQDVVNGTVTADANGDVVFTPTANYNGPASFTYTASDGNGGASTATVNLTVNPVNDFPVTVDDAGVVTQEDAAVTIAASTLLANDTDADGTLTIQSVQDAVNGVVALDVNGDVVFTPTADYNGPASFTYTVSDGNGGTSTATVSLTVNLVEDAPVAVNDSGVVTREDVAVTIAASTLLANDTDAEGDTLSIQSVQGGVNGTVALDANGDAVFTPTAGYNGPASFTYTVGDGNGGTSTGQVDVSVTAVELFTGTTGDDNLSGTAGDDRIEGGLGNDRLYGNAGEDVVVGGDGDDSAFGGDNDDEIDLGAGVDYGTGGAGNDVLSGGAGVDRLEGGAGDDRLYGDADNDVLVGEDGNDSAFGGDGDDTIELGAGADYGAGGAGNDNISGNAGADRLEGGTGNDSLYGGAGNDVLVGEDGDDSVFGEDGDDQIELGAGADYSTGGLGNDNVFGGAGVDWLEGGEGNDRIYGGDGNDTIMGDDGDDYGFGQAGDDRIELGAGVDYGTGGDGNDTLKGDAGNDRLEGDAGNDTLTGGAGDGADTIDNNDSSTDSTDKLEFGGAIDKNDLWFAQVDNDLVVSLLGTQDKVTVDNWYDSADNQLDQFVDSGGTTLDAASVHQLVAAMATFQPNDGTDATGVLPDQLPTDVQVAVDSAWQSSTP